MKTSKTSDFKPGDEVSFLVFERLVRPDGTVGLFDRRKRYTGVVLDVSGDYIQVKWTAKERVYEPGGDWSKWTTRTSEYTDNLYPKMNDVKLVARNGRKKS